MDRVENNLSQQWSLQHTQFGEALACLSSERGG